ncbi:tetratricopeptide repeat protein [bacterium]|nr:tetratricopeptide repeat protein [bacterium]
MKLNIFISLLCLILLGGCATSPYKSAQKFQENMEYNNAIREYFKILDPHIRDGKRYIYYDREAITGIGVVYWQMQRYDTAAKIFRMIVNKEPSYGKAYYYLGMSMEALGDEDEAIEMCKKYAMIPASDPYRHVLFGRLDYLVQRKISREIQAALQNEAQLRITDIPDKSVAVLYFLDLSNDPQWVPLQKGLAEMLITDLSQVEELKVVERLRLSRLMEELRLSTSGLMDESTAPRLGKLLGARHMVKGSYMVLTDLKMNVDAGIYRQDMISSPTTKSYESDLSRLFQTEKELVLQIFDYFGIRLTPEQRERILRYPTENMNAFMHYCRALDALDIGNFSQAQISFSQAVKADANFSQAKEWLMSPELWDATHNRNLVRADYEVAQIIRTTSKGRVEIVYMPSSDLISTWSRLRSMGVYQRAGYIPGNDSRDTFQEANIMGAPVIPELLGEPPKPRF